MQVAVAVICDHLHRVLITRRGLDKSHGGMWEFPGGKLEKNETAAKALYREIQEEVGLDILNPLKLGDIRHSYEKIDVTLSVFYITSFSGEAKCNESQLDLKWVAINELDRYDFPQANEKLIRLIQDTVFSNNFNSCSGQNSAILAAK